MTDTRPASAPRRSRRLLHGPDRRGEALHIFTTIFIRPARELGEPVGRLVRDLVRDLSREDRRGAQSFPNA